MFKMQRTIFNTHATCIRLVAAFILEQMARANIERCTLAIENFLQTWFR